MKYEVLAMSVNPVTGTFAVGGEPRVEVIDDETNEIFRNVAGLWEVEDRYLAFWNRLNEDWEYDPPGEKVVVLSVTEL